jgi:leucyl aminopeptidase
MTDPVTLEIAPIDLGAIAGQDGLVAVFADPGAGLDPGARRADRLTRGAVTRLVTSEAFTKLEPGEGITLAWPAGMAAEALLVTRLARNADADQARRAGAGIGKSLGPQGALVLAGAHRRAAEIAQGVMLRAYDFVAHRTGERKPPGGVRLMVTRPAAVELALAPLRSAAEGVLLTRDLVNEPANVLTTVAFAERLEALRDEGLEVEVLGEDELARLGLRALLAVGQGSDSPSQLVVLRWQGGGAEAPLALVGKGVVFDSGGISIKPSSGMEEMTMDMAGAGVVAGVMRALARRRAKANVVGLVGLVENMPDGRAIRPGDVLRTLKGDTVEVISTDAEGRLLLADLLWYAQDRFRPAAMIDLATLTGAIIVALGHENAGVFGNDDALAEAFLKAATGEGEGAWRMPLGAAYDKLLKSRIADMKNTGGRPAGAITATQFLRRFVRDETPWLHLDIAGVALRKDDSPLAPKGASGWGVRALDRLVRDRFEA